MEYNQDDLRRVQLVELDILKEIIRVCEKLNIRYFAIGGTDLGAMRHNGFIPWDDDIDVGMLRPDYERFLELGPAELRSGYTLQWYGNDPRVPLIYAKVRRSGTRFVERGRVEPSSEQGIFVDVMQFDRIPQDSLAVKRHRFVTRAWREILIAKTTRKITVDVPQPKRFAASAFRSTLHVILKPVSKKAIFARFDACLQRFNDGGGNRWSSRGRPAFECDYEDLMPPQPHAFEDITIMIPANPEKVLTTQYGDWRSLPPEEKRRNHAPLELSFGNLFS